MTAFQPDEIVLVVDDEPTMRALLELQLRRLGCDVIAAGTVAEAIEVLEREPVDAIVSDYAMPGGTGLNLLAYVRARGLSPRFVLTSAALPEGVAGAAEAGGAEIAAKEELVALLLAA
jgi:CheY-like chemotaxis protein